MGIGDHSNALHVTKKGSCHSIQTMYKRSQSPAFDLVDVKKRLSNCRLDNKKSECHWEKSRCSKIKIKHNRSRGSSSSSTRYADPEVLDMNINQPRTRTPSPSPRRSNMEVLNRSRYSSVDSRASSRASSKNSSMGIDKGKLDYKKLEKKIADLQKLLKTNAVTDKNK